jgi:hypothetical protein
MTGLFHDAWRAREEANRAQTENQYLVIPSEARNLHLAGAGKQQGPFDKLRASPRRFAPRNDKTHVWLTAGDTGSSPRSE